MTAFGKKSTNAELFRRGLLMDSSSVVVGLLFGVLISYMTAKINSRTQLKIAQGSQDTDIEKQKRAAFDSRLREEVALQRNKLEKLHTILSKLAINYSQTTSFIQSEDAMSLPDFRKWYFENCDSLHEATSIAAIFYPELCDDIGEIYGKSNIFWGYQEGVLRTNIGEKEEHWRYNYTKVIEASGEINERIYHIQSKIISRAKELSSAIQSA